MTRETLLKISQSTTSPMTPEFSRTTYDYLTREMSRSVHGQRFNIREFSLRNIDESRPSALDTSTQYIVTNDTPSTQLEWIAQTVLDLTMPRKDGEALTQAIGSVYYSNEVQDHLSLGGSILWASNHITYADKIAEVAALSIARMHAGEQQPNTTQDVLTHRLTALFQHDAVAAIYRSNQLDHYGGMVLEDIILPLANNLQTLPSSHSGRVKFIQEIADGKQKRKEMNWQTAAAFSQLLRLGRRSLHIALGGSQATVNEETGELEEKTVSHATAKLVTEPNQQDESERLLTIPIFLYVDPFEHASREIPVHPQPAPFAILQPRFLKRNRDVHEMMHEIITAGNQYKPSGKPTITYSSPLTKFKIRDQKPVQIIQAHSA